MENQQRFIPEEEVSASFKKLAASSNTLRQFLKQYDKTVKFPALYPLPKSKQGIGFTLFKDELFAHFFQDNKEICNRQIRLFFVLSVTRSVVSASKSFKLLASKTFEKRLSFNATAKCKAFLKVDTILPQSFEFLRAITMCSAFTPDCGYDSSTIIFIRDVYCSNTRCLGKTCLHKKTLQSLGRNDYQGSHCASVCQVRNIPFEEQTHSFFCRLVRGVYVFEESPKSIQDIMGDVCCPGNYCFNREKYESLGGYVATPRSNYGCGVCGAWLFVHKIPVMFQE